MICSFRSLHVKFDMNNDDGDDDDDDDDDDKINR